MQPHLVVPRTDRLLQAAFRLLCHAPVPTPVHHDTRYFQWRLGEAETFLARFGDRLDLRGTHVLDYGCGFGSTCVVLAQRGAAQVVGTDTDHDRLAFSTTIVQTDYPHLRDRVAFVPPDALGAARFDVVISQDCFEHYADPVAILQTIRGHLTDTGRVLIGFSPLWKSPSGGHIGYMTRVPWAHLLFPERVIMRERRRYRPDEDAQTFAEMRGGLNHMTYAKFLATIQASGYRIDALATNVSRHPARYAVNAIRHLPGCFEYFTKNLYAIVRPT